MTEILRFEMNVPAEVALKYAGPGKPIEGRYGNRVMYTLADNRVMYVAPIVASRISDLGIQPGEPFQVCKQEKKQGQRKLIEWRVQCLESEPETQLEHQLRESIEVAQAAKGTQHSESSGDPRNSLLQRRNRLPQSRRRPKSSKQNTESNPRPLYLLPPSPYRTAPPMALPPPLRETETASQLRPSLSTHSKPRSQRPITLKNTVPSWATSYASMPMQSSPWRLPC